MRWKLNALLAASAVGAMVLSGCSTVSDQSSSASSSGAASEASSPEAQAAQEQVAAASKAVDTFTAPGPDVPGVDQLKGKTVYFVPANGQIPLFQAIKGSLEASLGKAGITVEVCDGKANPANMASCIQQGVDAKAGAIITGSVDPALAPNAFKAAAAAGIPLVNMMTTPTGEGDPKLVAYLTPDFIKQQATAANWVIADSNAKANVLVVQITDTPVTTMWAEQGIVNTYTSGCPACKVSVVKANTGQLDKLGSLITSEVSKNPDLQYVQTEFDFAIAPTVGGLQAANATKVKISSQDGTLAALQSLQKGQFVASDVGFNADALAWYGADQAIRMMAGQASNQNVAFPYARAFNSTNIGELKLTPEAEKSGEWYGSTDYQAGFLKLWGLG